MARINGATMRKGGCYKKPPLNFLIGENEEIKPGGLTFYRDGKVSIVFSTIQQNTVVHFVINFDKDEWIYQQTY